MWKLKENAKLPRGIKQTDDSIFSVKSATVKGKRYTITLEPLGCECKGFAYYHHCRHLKALEKIVEWKEEYRGD